MRGLEPAVEAWISTSLGEQDPTDPFLMVGGDPRPDSLCDVGNRN